MNLSTITLMITLMIDLIIMLWMFLPECILIIGAMTILIYGVFYKNQKNVFKNSVFISILTLYLCLFASLFPFLGRIYYYFYFQLISNYYIVALKCGIFLFSLFISILSLSFFKYEKTLRSYEFPILILFATLGMCLIISSNDLIVFYLGVELQSLCLYVLASYKRNSNFSAEAGLKYFVLGSFASGFLIFGSSLIFGFLGTTNFNEIVLLLAFKNLGTLKAPVLLGLLFILVGILFKLPAAPFHNWAPDVYEGAPTIVTAFFAIVPKIAIVGVLGRILYVVFLSFSYYWIHILTFCAILSLIIGSLGALFQTSIKRFLAYSTITHVGFMLVGLSTGSLIGLSSSLLYLFVYISLNLGFFIILVGVRKGRSKKELVTINDLVVLSQSNPVLGFFVTLNLFSMAGIPPLIGFYSKFLILFSAVYSKLWLLAFISVLVSVISCAYYIRLVKIIYFGKPPQYVKIQDLENHTIFLIIALTIFNLFSYIFIPFMIDYFFICTQSLVHINIPF
jgi:NADH-quinone oxidoreductase subunit N